MQNYVYVDTSNIEAQVLSAKLSTTYGKIVSQLSFVESEILELPEEILQQLEESCPYQHYIKQLIKQKHSNYLRQNKY